MEPKHTAYVRLLNGPHKGGVFVLKELSVFEIGRGGSCQICINDPSVSINHARIYRKIDGWTFFDLNSETGSSINDIKVSKRGLEGGEILRVGSVELHFGFEVPKAKKQSPLDAARAASGLPPESDAQPQAPQVEAAPVLEIPGPKPAAPQAPAAAQAAPPVSSPPMLPVGAALHQQHQQPAQIPMHAEYPSAELDPPSAVDLSIQVQHAEPAHASPTPITTPQMQVRLKVIDGVDVDQGKELILASDCEYILGRSENCHLPLSDGKVSRLHCRVEFADGQFVLTDLNSANGTVLNGNRVNQSPLKMGDYVRLGFTVLTYEQIPVLT